ERRARRRLHLQPRGKTHRPDRSSRTLRQSLLRRTPAQSALHVRQHVGLFALREHAGRLRRLVPNSISSFRGISMLITSLVRFGYFCRLLSLVLLGMTVRESLADDKDSAKPNTEGNGDFVIGPDYKMDPDLTDKGNPKGKSFEFSMKLAESKIFPGDDKTLDLKKQVRK